MPGEIVYEEDVDKQADERAKFTQDFIEQLHASLTERQLENPEQLQHLYQRVLRDLSRKYRFMMNKSEINKEYQLLVKSKRVAPSFIIDSVTKNKSVRSRSGVLPISIATDGINFSCAYDCAFCPNETVANGAPRDMSRSYLSSEGTFIRGAVENFEAAGQVWRRLLELEFMGHPPDKCEIIVLGGTWDSYTPEYREYFITQTFYACNMFHKMSLRMNGDLAHLTREWSSGNPFQKGMAFDPEGKIKSQLRPPRTLDEEKAENQDSPCSRIIGILLETRPDQISKPSLQKLRWLGCTRVQLGVQHTDNEILKLNNRGHGVEKSISAIKFARDNAFKVDGHLMPDLPGTTASKDYEMLSRVFGGEDLQLDYCKIYPCLDLPYTKTRQWKQQGLWTPIAENDFTTFLDMLRHACATVPPWVRINRVQRDFPEATEKNQYLGFVSDHIKSNLQQMVMKELEKNDERCYDVRSREIKNQFPVDCDRRARLFVRVYRATEGTEFFLSVELPSKSAKCADDAILMGLLRLRFTDVDICRIQGEDVRVPSHYMPEFAARPMARIRELHVYGNLRMVNPSSAANEDRLSQHTGVGKYLMAVAEHISHAYGYGNIAVISGVGVRSYYAKLGYVLHSGPGEFMIKDIASEPSLLPCVFFGTAHHPDRVLTPISEFTITRAHLPTQLNQMVKNQGFGWTRGWNLFTNATPSLAKWYIHHAYPHIQGGRAQLAVINVIADVPSSKQSSKSSVSTPAHNRAAVQPNDLRAGKRPKLNDDTPHTVSHHDCNQEAEEAAADVLVPTTMAMNASRSNAGCTIV